MAWNVQEQGPCGGVHVFAVCQCVALNVHTGVGAGENGSLLLLGAGI